MQCFDPSLEVTAARVVRDKGLLVLGFSNGDIAVQKIFKRTFGKIELATALVLSVQQAGRKTIRRKNCVRLLRAAVAVLLMDLKILPYKEHIKSQFSKSKKQGILYPQHLELQFGSGDECSLFVGTNETFILRYDLSTAMKQRLEELRDTKVNIVVKNRFNFSKKVTTNYEGLQDYLESVKSLARFDGKEVLDLRTQEYTHVNLSSMSELKSMKTITRNNQLYLLATYDAASLSILDSQLKLLCNMNVNHPLPIKWNLPFVKDLEIVDHLAQLQRFFSNGKFGQSAEPVIAQLIQDEKAVPVSILKPLVAQFESIEEKVGKKSVKLMRDTFHPKDLIYDLIKSNSSDLSGPSLYQLERKRQFAHRTDEEEEAVESQKVKDEFIEAFNRNVKVDMGAGPNEDRSVQAGSVRMIEEPLHFQTEDLKSKIRDSFVKEEKRIGYRNNRISLSNAIMSNDLQSFTHSKASSLTRNKLTEGFEHAKRAPFKTEKQKVSMNTIFVSKSKSIKKSNFFKPAIDTTSAVDYELASHLQDLHEHPPLADGPARDSPKVFKGRSQASTPKSRSRLDTTQIIDHPASFKKPTTKSLLHKTTSSHHLLPQLRSGDCSLEGFAGKPKAPRREAAAQRLQGFLQTASLKTVFPSTAGKSIELKRSDCRAVFPEQSLRSFVAKMDRDKKQAQFSRAAGKSLQSSFLSRTASRPTML